MKPRFFLLLFIFSSVFSFAQTIDWNVILKDNNIYKQPVNAQSFQFLDSLVKDKRIVMLGEREHDHGASRSTISKMIRYLHENCGFNTLVLEHHIPRIKYFNQCMQDSIGYLKTMKESFLDGYNFNDDGLYRYLYNNYHTPNKIEVLGGDIDISIGAPLTTKFINQVETNIIYKYKLSDSLQTQWKYLKENMFNIPYNHLLSNTYKKKFDSFSDQLLKVDTNIRHSLEYIMLRNHTYYEWSMNHTMRNEEFFRKYPNGSMDWGKTRDSLMALTLDWMLTYGPLKNKEKIIITFSAWHIADNLASIGKRIKAIDQAIPMRELLPSKYDKQIYSIAFVNYTGHKGYLAAIGYNYAPTRVLPTKEFIRKRGIEYQLAKRGFEEGFVDFSNVNKKYSFYMSPTFQDKEYFYTWTNVYSGIYFIKNQEGIYRETLSFIKDDDELRKRYNQWKIEKKTKYFD